MARCAYRQACAGRAQATADRGAGIELAPGLRRRVVRIGARVLKAKALRGTARVLLEEFAPHAALFPRASVVVHQGGAGTVHQGLLSGRPTLVVPFAHDQPDNAWRVERLGVSRTIRPKRYTARAVGRTLDMLLSEDTFAARAAEVADSGGWSSSPVRSAA